MFKPMIFALGALWLLSACGPSEPTSAAKPSNPTTPNASNTAASTSSPIHAERGEYDAQIDQALQEMQAQLPIKSGNVMEISSITRSGKSIDYTFTIFSEAITPKDLGLKRNQNTAIKQLCEEADTKRFLNAGYNMNFHYVFRNQEKLTIHLKQADC